MVSYPSPESKRESVAVLGGRIGGLSLAYEFLKRGFKVRLFEATGNLGGLASIFQFGDIWAERFYHFNLDFARVQYRNFKLGERREGYSWK